MSKQKNKNLKDAKASFFITYVENRKEFQKGYCILVFAYKLSK